MKARVRDILAADSTSYAGVVDASTGSRDLAAFFDRNVVRVTRDHSLESVPSDHLLVLTLGPDPRVHGSSADAIASAGRVQAGGRALVLLGWPPADLATTDVAERLAALDLACVLAAATSYPDLPIALLVERRPAESPDLSPGDAVGDRAAAIRRDLSMAAAEWLAEEVATLTVRLTARGAATDPVVRVAELTRERGALAASLRKSEAELASTREQLDMLERSAQMRLGRAMVDAAKNPRTAVRLPREAVRMWRVRGGRAGLAQARAKSEAAAESDEVKVEVDVDRLMAWRSVDLAPRTGMSVLGVIQPDTLSVLSSAAVVERAKPDDLLELFHRSDPDIVLIETAVSEPSSPWAYLGNAAASEREARLLGVLDAAQATERPVVLWRNTPVHETAALGDLAGRCDLVVDSAPARSGGTTWSVGVSLAQSVALGADASARTALLYAGGLDQRDSARRRATLLEALVAGAGRTVVRPRSSGPAADGMPTGITVGLRLRRGEYSAACGDAAVVLASPFVVPDSMLGLRDDDLVALAAGARLVSGPNRDLAALEGLGDAVVVAAEGDVARAVRDALDAGPLTAEEHLHVLRTIFVEHSVPARLAQLTRRLALGVDVEHERRVALLVDPGTVVDTASLVEAVLAQRHRPCELVLARGDLAEPRALDELSSVGVSVRVVSSLDPTRADLARAADSTWVLTWSPGPDGTWTPNHLLDLMIGAEAGVADAVGLTREGGLRTVDELADGSVLLRRSCVVDDAHDSGDLRRWSRRGRTLVAVGSGATS